MKSKIKNIVFDYGGTLDTHGVHWSEKFWEAYQQFHLPVEKEDFRKAYVYSERNISNLIKDDFGLEKTYKTQIYYQIKYLESNNLLSGFSYVMIDELVKYLINQVKNNIELTKLTLSILEQDYTLGVISNYYGNVETVLAELDIRKYFALILDSTIVGFRKPDERIFEIISNNLNAHVDETVMVGDSFGNDIIPAKSLGWKTIWIKVKGWNEIENRTGADYIINSLKQLPDVIQKME